MWMIRAGEGAYLVDDFEKTACVSIGWNEIGDLSDIANESDLKSKYLASFQGQHTSKSSNAVAMIKKFRFDMKVGDLAITYNPSSREYLVGEIISDYTYVQDIIDDESFNHIRKVKWLGHVSRDALSVSSRNTLGSTLTVFAVNQDVASEIKRNLDHQQPNQVEVLAEENEKAIEQSRNDVIEQSSELIKDRIIAISPEDMEYLVAGVLRAMGYRTRVSNKGMDRGVDIFASPDGIGLESPRIKVEVKHQKNKRMTSQHLRSFIGGLREGDRALYVSTGGFTKDAKYEADRSNIPLTLIDIDDLMKLITEHYDEFDIETRVLLPLTKVYWPR
ncbi:restriction endonuclease [Pseudoalteromonas luteoviolacea]|uniref:restriction endonuclease n=1 Tax=Pseudoalteromonas luteoviolacea TaxID=43657 RepID=UPI001EEE954C|nr:restriction endonuclease [Pseudoalteromonas luteoviolacea]MCF6441406.1 restriction endonuclease [Pseudoalteromonas luteoviolacea]